MLAKVLTTVLTAALAVMVVRHIGQRVEKSKAKVRTNKRADETSRVTTLREDPETGVFRPVDRD
jgi:hypothetical protein